MKKYEAPEYEEIKYETEEVLGVTGEPDASEDPYDPHIHRP